MKTNKKIHIILGTKAQLIKMAPIMKKLQKKEIPYNFIFTGQHKETIDKLRENFSIKEPDITLYKGKDITGIGQMFLWILKMSWSTIWKKKEIFGETTKNDVLLTHGDTFSTVLGALIGKIARIKVGHVESGLRSFNIFSPFPEELNRIITFYLADYYYCPGEWAVNNLKKFKGEKINTEINTLYESLQLALKTETNTELKIPNEKFVVASIHRFENIFKKDQFRKILRILEELSKKIKILIILHPPTQKQLEKFGLIKQLKENPNIELRPRYDYINFIHLLNKSEFLITDGGSNQEEAFYMGKPCLLMRETTERQEGLNKNVVISKFNEKDILEFANNYNKYQIETLKNQNSPSEIIIKHINEI
jgi:UDP-N-acetylglucosamine 2-epimerase (non-hydrolysing)